MDPLHLAIALGPLAAYFLLIGLINIRKRVFVTTGARDTATLGVALCGLVMAGPMELFLPERAAAEFKGWVWLLLLGLYLLVLTLIVLLMRPRILVYNATYEQVRPALGNVVMQLDSESRWAGNCVLLPELGVQLTLESSPVEKHVQLVAAGANQQFSGWRKLEAALAKELAKTPGQINPYGYTLLSCGGIVACMITYFLLNNPAQVMQTLGQLLRTE